MSISPIITFKAGLCELGVSIFLVLTLSPTRESGCPVLRETNGCEHRKIELLVLLSYQLLLSELTDFVG
jgi:hypothetical protein